jgi:hypothetical protein
MAFDRDGNIITAKTSSGGRFYANVNTWCRHSGVNNPTRQGFSISPLTSSSLKPLKFRVPKANVFQICIG